MQNLKIVRYKVKPENQNILTSLTYIPDANGEYKGEFITVNFNEDAVILDSATIKENGMYSFAKDDFKGVDTVIVNVPIKSGKLKSYAAELNKPLQIVTREEIIGIDADNIGSITIPNSLLQDKGEVKLIEEAQIITCNPEYYGLSRVIIPNINDHLILPRNEEIITSYRVYDKCEIDDIIGDYGTDAMYIVPKRDISGDEYKKYGFKYIHIPNTKLQYKMVRITSATEKMIISPDEGFFGLSSVSIPPITSMLESKEVTITDNGKYTVVPSEDFAGMSSVEITTNVNAIPTVIASIVKIDERYYIKFLPKTSNNIDNIMFSLLKTSNRDGEHKITLSDTINCFEGYWCFEYGEFSGGIDGVFLAADQNDISILESSSLEEAEQFLNIILSVQHHCYFIEHQSWVLGDFISDIIIERE